MTAVTVLAEAGVGGGMGVTRSIRLSAGASVDWTMKTSSPLIFVGYLTQISPSLNFLMTAAPISIPAALAIPSASGLLAVPEKIFSLLMTVRFNSVFRVTLPPSCWGGRIRTSEWRLQRPLPYHLATPQ